MTKEHEQDRALLHDLHGRLAAGSASTTEAEVSAVLRVALAYRALTFDASPDREMLLACDEDAFALVDVLARIVIQRSHAYEERSDAECG